MSNDDTELDNKLEELEATIERLEERIEYFRDRNAELEGDLLHTQDKLYEAECDRDSYHNEWNYWENEYNDMAEKAENLEYQVDLLKEEMPHYETLVATGMEPSEIVEAMSKIEVTIKGINNQPCPHCNKHRWEAADE